MPAPKPLTLHTPSIPRATTARGTHGTHDHPVVSTLPTTQATSTTPPVTIDPAITAGKPGQLRDQYGRVAHDLRVSLTDRCNLRCTYCMPADGLPWIPTEECLTDEEVIRLITIGVERLHISQVRFTGGEPLLRKSLAKIIAATSALTTASGAPVHTALTTNGLGLDKQAKRLAAAGLNRVNISLDSLDRTRYHQLSRRDRLDDVLAGIAAAHDAGLTPVKINTVIMPGINEVDILPMARWAITNGYHLRFIEQMPLGPAGKWDRSGMVTAAEIMHTLRTGGELTPAQLERGSAPADLWRYTLDNGETGHIGIIASVTRPFCGACDRTRLTTDGAIRNCLFSHEETSLRDLLRQGADDTAIATAWAQAMWGKLPGHGINDPGFLQPDRTMSAIGG
ncbi:GTP 3',8-cyclase MoaA [Corynebacterium choanae]|uniref:GTP 3',8-cyclase n=1 Tax=Corynebacterium choanae TaxID=1862358 RepID=A0A3G6J661_9CORY|nr:GTP 3',8-cyclase MoaA [Corynebacterium choanae]AZA13436.1 Cyclic pyranopterin monophosphate synthase [Corynebacterium choanae]